MLGLLVLGPARAFADDEPDPPPLPPETIEQKMLRGNIEASRWLDSFADSVDMYLMGERITKKRNDTYVKLSNSTYSNNGQGPNNQSNIDASLRLPNLEEYWQLKFTDYDQTQEQTIRQSNLRSAPRARNYGATLGLFQKLGNVRVKFLPRVNLRNPLDISYNLGFESEADMKTYMLKPKIEFYAASDKGTGAFVNLDADVPMSKYYSLTLINESEYVDKLHSYTVTNGFSINEPWDETRGLSYSWVFSSLNQPSYHLDNHSIAVTFSQILYHNILDYSVTPHLDFTRDSSFTGNPGLTFTFNLNF
jgi:hypothetical protein